MPLNNNV